MRGRQKVERQSESEREKMRQRPTKRQTDKEANGYEFRSK